MIRIEEIYLPIRDTQHDLTPHSYRLFYDMVKSGSSLGINVLQGLVKVERGEEAERNGLVGARPLSVSNSGTTRCNIDMRCLINTNLPNLNIEIGSNLRHPSV